MTLTPHQFIERDTGMIRTEKLYADRLIRLLYHEVRENAPFLFRLLTGARASSLLGSINFDAPFAGGLRSNSCFVRECGIDFGECVQPPHFFDTPRKIFERQIRYWEFRPMPHHANMVVSPADARVLLGSFREPPGFSSRVSFSSIRNFSGATGIAGIGLVLQCATRLKPQRL